MYLFLPEKLARLFLLKVINPYPDIWQIATTTTTLSLLTGSKMKTAFTFSRQNDSSHALAPLSLKKISFS